jgi:hypothetical protein
MTRAPQNRASTVRVSPAPIVRGPAPQTTSGSPPGRLTDALAYSTTATVPGVPAFRMRTRAVSLIVNAGRTSSMRTSGCVAGAVLASPHAASSKAEARRKSRIPEDTRERPFRLTSGKMPPACHVASRHHRAVAGCQGFGIRSRHACCARSCSVAPAAPDRRALGRRHCLVPGPGYCGGPSCVRVVGVRASARARQRRGAGRSFGRWDHFAAFRRGRADLAVTASGAVAARIAARSASADGAMSVVRSLRSFPSRAKTSRS